MTTKKKTTSFSQFDGGKGTAAAKRGKAPAKKPASKKPASKPATTKAKSKAKKHTYEDKLRDDAKSYRKRVLRGGAK